MKRAADLAEALYSMPRNNQLALTAAGSPRSPSAISASAQQAAAMHAGFNSYSGQLAVSVQENAVTNGQWAEGKYSFFKIIFFDTLVYVVHNCLMISI